MNRTHHKTLVAIFSLPVPATLAWHRIEALFVTLGAEVIEGRGARVGFKLNGERADFHRPHPGKEAKPYQVRAAREFLERIGVTP
ncbi:MAG: type II toxin-antitoxin system HicA family toxin [Magnetococcales bacterium]|nr:type II toxin-antitoxin system HicA family toxin [Magnetococcales bacterium]